MGKSTIISSHLARYIIQSCNLTETKQKDYFIGHDNGDKINLWLLKDDSARLYCPSSSTLLRTQELQERYEQYLNSLVTVTPSTSNTTTSTTDSNDEEDGYLSADEGYLTCDEYEFNVDLKLRVRF